MARYRGSRRLGWSTAALCAALVVSIVGCGSPTPTPEPTVSPFARKLIDSGYARWLATYLAGAKVVVSDPRANPLHMVLTYPGGGSADDVTIEVLDGQQYAPTPNEVAAGIEGRALGVSLTRSFSGNQATFELGFFVAGRTTSSLPSDAPVLAAYVAPWEAAAIPLAEDAPVDGSQVIVTVTHEATKESNKQLLERGIKAGGVAGHAAEEIFQDLDASLAVAEAYDLGTEGAKYLQRLEELRRVAEDPANPETIRMYAEDPGTRQQNLDEIDAAIGDVEAMTIAAVVATAIGGIIDPALGFVGVGGPVVSIVTGTIVGTAVENLRQVMEERLREIEKMLRGYLTPGAAAPQPAPTGLHTAPPSSTDAPRPAETPPADCAPLGADVCGHISWVVTSYPGGVLNVPNADPKSVVQETDEVAGDLWVRMRLGAFGPDRDAEPEVQATTIVALAEDRGSTWRASEERLIVGHCAGHGEGEGVAVTSELGVFPQDNGIILKVEPARGRVEMWFESGPLHGTADGECVVEGRKADLPAWIGADYDGTVGVISMDGRTADFDHDDPLYGIHIAGTIWFTGKPVRPGASGAPATNAPGATAPASGSPEGAQPGSGAPGPVVRVPLVGSCVTPAPGQESVATPCPRQDPGCSLALAAPGVDWSGCDLRLADLSGANLSSANLAGANLAGAKLTGANLKGANLHGASLFLAGLSGAILSGANLYGTNLYGATLDDGDLTGANLDYADLSATSLASASLRNAKLRHANLIGADLRGASLKDADLSMADLTGAVTTPTDTSGVIWDGAVCPDGTNAGSGATAACT